MAAKRRPNLATEHLRRSLLGLTVLMVSATAACDGLGPMSQKLPPPDASAGEDANDAGDDIRPQPPALDVASAVPSEVDGLVIADGVDDWLAVAPHLTGPTVWWPTESRHFDGFPFDGERPFAIARRDETVVLIGWPASDAAEDRALAPWIRFLCEKHQDTEHIVAMCRTGDGRELTSRELPLDGVDGGKGSIVSLAGTDVAVSGRFRGLRLIWPARIWSTGRGDVAKGATRWMEEVAQGDVLTGNSGFVSTRTTLNSQSGASHFLFAQPDKPATAPLGAKVVGVRVSSPSGVDGPRIGTVNALFYGDQAMRQSVERLLPTTTRPRQTSIESEPGSLRFAVTLAPTALQRHFEERLSDEARESFAELANERQEGVDLSVLQPAMWTGRIVVDVDSWDAATWQELRETGDLRLVPALVDGWVAIELAEPNVAIRSLRQQPRVRGLAIREVAGDRFILRGRDIDGERARSQLCFFDAWMVIGHRGPCHDNERGPLRRGETSPPWAGATISLEGPTADAALVSLLEDSTIVSLGDLIVATGGQSSSYPPIRGTVEPHLLGLAVTLQWAERGTEDTP